MSRRSVHGECTDVWEHTDVQGDVQMYGVYRCRGDVQIYGGVYRHMGIQTHGLCIWVYKCMGGCTDILGHINVQGAHRCMWGCTDVRGSVQMYGGHTDIQGMYKGHTGV